MSIVIDMNHSKINEEFFFNVYENNLMSHIIFGQMDRVIKNEEKKKIPFEHLPIEIIDFRYFFV